MLSISLISPLLPGVYTLIFSQYPICHPNGNPVALYANPVYQYPNFGTYYQMSFLQISLIPPVLYDNLAR